MTWLEEMNHQILNEDTIIKPWKTYQFIKLFEYLIENGTEEFTRFSNETEKLNESEKNFLQIIGVPAWGAVSPTKEKWKEILEQYPNIKKFLEDNNMLDRRMLCSDLYFESLFDWDLSKNPNLAKTFLENMKKIEHLNADICWVPIGICPFSNDANSLFAWLSQATYDITDKNEKLIFIKKYYCGVDLEYDLLYNYFTEKNARKYRHDIYTFEYKKAKDGFVIGQAANHGWVLQVINNGKNINKIMCLQGFRMSNPLYGAHYNLPSLEEVERFDLTDEMKNCKKDKELTKEYEKYLEKKKSLKKQLK